ncbi:sensor histidine kinase [Streptomyces sp. XM4193]|uniref:ATP-binding protein n=1 Tax=Streptomyces sp. XM4193 TaxID=2929782 RepID=UPI001FF8C780|nr:sensor histidine kinase [Streptomyces sp. XM4193]MCK1795379.1 sensor histidine kinase [Streptomyces sp. XM4193]
MPRDIGDSDDRDTRDSGAAGGPGRRGGPLRAFRRVCGRLRRHRLSLTGSLFVGYATLLVLALVVTGALWVAHHDRQLDRQYTERVLTIGRSVAAMPEISEALASADPPAVIDPLADRVGRATGAEYVVVATPDGIRMSHVDDRLIGKRVSTPPGPAGAGEEWSGQQTGTQGTSVRAKVPILGGPSGEDVLGYVSVGVLTSDIATEATDALPSIMGTVAAVLTLGAAGAYVLSRRVRAKTYGLEPADITALLESREALLHAVREGVIAVDNDDRLVLVNPPARQLLSLPDACEGTALEALELDSRLRDIIGGATEGEDQIVLIGARVLVCNRMPVSVHGRAAGAVVTLRDRTELDRLTGELDGARTVTRGLRSQSHEFANRIHTLAGLLELGEVEEARAYLTDLSAAHARASGQISGHIADSAVAALALAKSAQADEQNAELRLSPMSRVPYTLPGGLRADVLLVLGNLLDNALDAVTGRTGEEGWVELLIRVHPADGDELPHDLVEIRVIDSGHGVGAGLAEEIFEYGFTTKAADSRNTRGLGEGLGLALVRQVCESRGGSVGVEVPGDAMSEEGAVFTAYLPVSDHPFEDETDIDDGAGPDAPVLGAGGPRTPRPYDNSAPDPSDGSGVQPGEPAGAGTSGAATPGAVTSRTRTAHTPGSESSSDSESGSGSGSDGAVERS